MNNVSEVAFGTMSPDSFADQFIIIRWRTRQRENNRDRLDCVVPLQFDVKYATEYEIFPTLLWLNYT